MITSPATVVIATVARFHGIATAQLLGVGRSRRFSEPRHLAFWLCHEVCGMGVSEIGRKFDRDHGTVSAGLKQARRRMEAHASVRRTVNEMAAIVRASTGEREAFAVLRTLPKAVTFRMDYPRIVDCVVSRETVTA